MEFKHRLMEDRRVSVDVGKHREESRVAVGQTAGTLSSEEQDALKGLETAVHNSISTDLSKTILKIVFALAWEPAAQLRLQEVEAAAVKIQASFKGKAARKEVEDMKAQKLKDAEQAAKKSAPGLERAKERNLVAQKKQALSDWEPEYSPESIVPPTEKTDTITARATRVSLPLIMKDQFTM
eukprot:gene18554-22150_t